MSREQINKIWFVFYRVLGCSISGFQAYKYFTDKLEFNNGEIIICALALTMVFKPLLIPQLLRSVVDKISSNSKCKKDAD